MSIILPNNNQFTRRVSFNNLNPEYIDGDLPVVATNNKPKLQNPTFGYGSTLINDISKIYSQSTAPIYRKRLKLPDPPSKSILKNKYTPPSLNDNLSTTYYHEESVLDSDTDSDSEVQQHTQHQLKSRRKSYSEMTDEELMELDPQYKLTKSKTTNVDQFKFDSQKTYYLPSARKSSVIPSNLKLVYPSSNENNYKSISLTVKHEDYDKITLKRTLLTLISGRKHTWNSIDWLLLINQPKNQRPFLEDGDHLIIGSLIPTRFLKDAESKKKILDDYLYKKCENLLNYIINQVSKDLKLKITVEFITDNSAEKDLSAKKLLVGNKYILSHLYKQYQPTLIIVGNKSTNLNFKYPRKIKNTSGQKAEYLIKLSSYVIKYSTIPVIVVGNNTIFHYRNEQKPPTITITFVASESPSPRKDSSVSATSAESSSSIESVESYNGENSTSATKLDNLWNSTSEDKFKDMITLISDKSLNDSKKYLIAINSKDDNLKIDNKIHSIYKSQTNNSNSNRDSNSNERIYKVKSLISYDEDEELKNEKLRKEKKKLMHNKKKDIKRDKKKSIWQKLGLKK